MILKIIGAIATVLAVMLALVLAVLGIFLGLAAAWSRKEEQIFGRDEDEWR